MTDEEIEILESARSWILKSARSWILNDAYNSDSNAEIREAKKLADSIDNIIRKYKE